MALFHFAEYGTGDCIFLDFLGAFVNFSNLGISIKAFDLILGHIAVSPQQLDRLVGNFDRRAGCVHLGHRRQFGVNAALVIIPGGLVSNQARKLNFSGHVGQFVLGDLKLSDFSAKLFPFFHIGKGAIIGTLSSAQRLGSNQNAALIKKFKDLIKALAFLADNI